MTIAAAAKSDCNLRDWADATGCSSRIRSRTRHAFVSKFFSGSVGGVLRVAMILLFCFGMSGGTYRPQTGDVGVPTLEGRQLRSRAPRRGGEAVDRSQR